MTTTTPLRERIEREADAHDYFAANADLRMTTGDHAARAKNLRAIAAALSARDEAGAVGEVRIENGCIVSTSIKRPLADGGYDVVPQVATPPASGEAGATIADDELPGMWERAFGSTATTLAGQTVALVPVPVKE